VIAAGGTAGHVKPAMAVAAALRAEGAHVTFIGTGRGAGHGLVGAAGYEEDVLPMRGLARSLSPANLRTLWLTLAAVPRAMAILRRRRAQAVMGGGGYLAGPVAVAARILRIPVVLTEADSHLGLANRLAAPLARRVALAFPIPGRDEPRFTVTGRPVGPDITGASRDAGRAALDIPADAVCVLVAGGSQGARSINTAVATAYRDGPPFTLVHLAGARNLDDVRAILGGDPPDGYRLLGYLDGFGDAVAAADLVVSRAGGSVFELAAIGRPSILVPYPHATGDHQTGNARWLEQAGAAVLVPDAECTAERLSALIADLLADPDRLRAMGNAAREVARPDAAQRIAAMLIEMAR